MLTLDPQIMHLLPEKASASDRFFEPPEQLLKRARHLRSGDRRLVELALRDRLTHLQLAKASNCSRWTVTRRLQRLTRRLNEPMVVALLDERCPLLPRYRVHRQLMLEVRLEFRTVRQLADSHRLSVWNVRQMLRFVRDWHQSFVLTMHREKEG
jgi:hypothetical protein